MYGQARIEGDLTDGPVGFAVSELLDTLRAGDVVDLVRESVRLVLQELIEAEAAQVIGAGRYERTPERVTERNGSRPRELMTKAGTVELAIPKLLDPSSGLERGGEEGPGPEATTSIL